MEPNGATQFSYEDLKSFTNNFDQDNFIGPFQYGRVFRGKMGSQPVTVKIFELVKNYTIYEGENEPRLKDEVLLLTTLNHPSLVKLIGYCDEYGHLCVVYDLEPLNTVRNLLLEDDFTWLRRIKVALRFACLLEYMQTESSPDSPCLLRNLDSAHIMLDQDYNPKLYDFSMISGGIFPDRRDLRICYLSGCFGYTDPTYIILGEHTEKTDVFAFGVILLNMITKRVNTEEERKTDVIYVYHWAQSEYEAQKSKFGFGRSTSSLVHQSLKGGRGYNSRDGFEIMKLAIQCVDHFPGNRPTIKQVVKRLLKLHAVRCHAKLFGISQLLPRHDYMRWKYSPMRQIGKICVK